MDFQVVVVSDNSTGKTYAIFTYNCTSPDVETYMNFPDELSGTIGINIPNVSLEIFRYSDTPFAVELRCLNIREGETFVNLVYDLTPASSTSGSSSIAPGKIEKCCCKYILALFS